MRRLTATSHRRRYYVPELQVLWQSIIHESFQVVTTLPCTVQIGGDIVVYQAHNQCDHCNDPWRSVPLLQKSAMFSELVVEGMFAGTIDSFLSFLSSCCSVAGGVSSVMEALEGKGECELANMV